MKKISNLYYVELRRLILSKSMWLILLLCIVSPLMGYTIYTPCSPGDAISNQYIANPVLAGTILGAVLFAVITIVETDRLHRSQTDILTDSITSPVVLSTVKIFSLLTISAGTTGIISLIYFPFTSEKMEYLFMPGFYFFNFLVFMLPTWWISILAADSFYQITRRTELSILLYALFAYFSFSSFSADDYFLRWINPLISTYSDGFPSYWPLRIGIYTRILWLALITGFWLLSLTCIRKYQKGFFSCFFLGLKKIYLPLAAAVFLFTGTVLWIYQPFVDHGPEEFDMDYIYKYDDVPLLRIINAHYYLNVDPVMGTMSGRAEYTLGFTSEGESMIKLNPGYKVTEITYDKKSVAYKTLSDDINGERSTVFELPYSYGKTLVIEYKGFPAVARYFYPDSVFNHIDPDHISLRNYSLIPGMIQYNNYTDNTIFEITIPDHLTPFLEYKLMEDCTDNNDGTKTYKISIPLVSPSFYAGNYNIDSFSAAGINIDFAYGNAYKKAVEDYGIHQSVIDVFNYCSEHYGESGYASSNKRLMLFQNSALTPGGSAHEGYCDWFESYLSPTSLNDTELGANSTETFIHEMIHQWWGAYGLDFFEEWPPTSEETSLWSSEGLTVYSTYRLVKEKYGRLYAEKYYVDEWKKAVEMQDRNFYNRHKEYLTMLPEKYQARINENNNSINFYSRMPLMILKAEELVGGEEKMDQILSRIYADRKQYIDTGFTYQDFLTYCNLKKEDLYLD